MGNNFLFSNSDKIYSRYLFTNVKKISESATFLIKYLYLYAGSNAITLSISF